jgi:hypothetical protein
MLFEDFVFHRFEDFGLPIFVCSVPFLTENGRGENIERERERERERGGEGRWECYEEEERERERKRGGSCEEEEKKIEKRERREAMCYFRIKIMHWVPLGLG